MFSSTNEDIDTNVRRYIFSYKLDLRKYLFHLNIRSKIQDNCEILKITPTSGSSKVLKEAYFTKYHQVKPK